MRIERLYQALGRDFAERLRHYIKKYYTYKDKIDAKPVINGSLLSLS